MLPDITRFGPYTYLVTEVFWGTIAAALIYRAGVVRKAALTILALYPIGYAWDWYSLEVGIFSIPKRTGIEVLGIPLEEHIFMLVVPSLVIGVHETIHGDDAPAGSGSADLPSN